MNDPVRFGILGCGTIAPTHARAIAAAGGGVLAGAVSRRYAQAQAFAHEFSCRAYETYEQMLADSTSYKFYFDRNVPFVPTTEINPENLEFLYRCRDMNVFERMVFGSDWQHYPFTICTLLYMHERYYGGQSLKLIEEAIHFNDYYEGGYNGNREVSAEDWNMTQQWMMFHLGLDQEKGGWINLKRFADFKSKEVALLHHAIMVKPLIIDQPSSSSNLKEML